LWLLVSDTTSSIANSAKNSIGDLTNKIGDFASASKDKLKEKYDNIDWDDALEIAIYVGVGCLALVLIYCCLKCGGFAARGITKGSRAAGYQSVNGPISRGSTTAHLQSIQATRCLLRPKMIAFGGFCGLLAYLIVLILD